MQKLGNTFTVIAGSLLEENEEKQHVGLFDYATFFIPWLILKLATWGLDLHLKKSTWWNIPLSFILPIPIFLTVFLHSLRWLVAAAVTIAALPLVLVVHLISNIFTEPLRKILGDIQINLNENHRNYGIAVDNSLKENPNLEAVLSSYCLVLDDLDGIIRPVIDDNEDKLALVELYARGEQLGSVSLNKSDLAYYSLQFFNVGGLSYKTENNSTFSLEP